jgi:hypothetical protein
MVQENKRIHVKGPAGSGKTWLVPNNLHFGHSKDLKLESWSSTAALKVICRKEC